MTVIIMDTEVIQVHNYIKFSKLCVHKEKLFHTKPPNMAWQSIMGEEYWNKESTTPRMSDHS